MQQPDDSQIDSLLIDLDKHATRHGGPNYGLPVFDEEERAPLREVVRAWLAAQQR